MKKNKKKIVIVLFLFFIFFVIISKKNKNIVPEVIDDISDEFVNEEKVNIVGYEGNAMEPYISRDEKYLFFNDNKDNNGHDKDIFYAEKINDTVFQFKGEVKGVNSEFVDGNPSMDKNNNFYFISTRDLKGGNSGTIYKGIFDNGIVKDVEKIQGSINIKKIAWINMGVEISEDGNIMYTSNAHFNIFSSAPSDGDIHLAIRDGKDFNIPVNEHDILKNINTEYAIEYAGEVSNDGLDMFYSQLILSKPPQFKMYHAKRENKQDPFGRPKLIIIPFEEKNDFVEAPTISSDKNRVYYHKLDDGKFSIFMISRK